MPTDCPGIPARLAAVHERVAEAARAAGRDPHEVRVLLATKTQEPAVVVEAVAAALDLAWHRLSPADEVVDAAAR